MNEKGEIIDSVDSLKKKLQSEHDIEARKKEITYVLRDELRMRYKKINSVSIHANSIKNLVLRQQFALEFIKQWHKKKIIINIDETWLGMTDFHRRKWRLHHDFNSVAKL